MSSRGRRALAPEEAALWQRVIATVTPLEKRRVKAAAAHTPQSAVPEKEGSAVGASHVAASPSPAARGRPEAEASRTHRPPLSANREGSEGRRVANVARKPEPGNTLDASWDRRLSRGLVAPESAIDLHGYTLASAYDRLDAGLEQAIAQGDRVLLLITGKPPRPDSERPHARGAIRAAVGDWIKASRHADRIAAVRGAHPRHGGGGALYIVLRRAR